MTTPDHAAPANSTSSVVYNMLAAQRSDLALLFLSVIADNILDVVLDGKTDEEIQEFTDRASAEFESFLGPEQEAE